MAKMSAFRHPLAVRADVLHLCVRCGLCGVAPTYVGARYGLGPSNGPTLRIGPLPDALAEHVKDLPESLRPAAAPPGGEARNVGVLLRGELDTAAGAVNDGSSCLGHVGPILVGRWDVNPNIRPTQRARSTHRARHATRVGPHATHRGHSATHRGTGRLPARHRARTARHGGAAETPLGAAERNLAPLERSRQRAERFAAAYPPLTTCRCGVRQPIWPARSSTSSSSRRA